MAIRRYRYDTHHAVLRHQLASSLEISDARWNQVVGSNGSFEGWITVPNDEDQVELIRGGTEPLVAAIYIRKSSSSEIIWGGPIVSRGWDGGRLKIVAIEWRAWLFQTVVPPDINTDIYYSFDNEDQLVIARTLAMAARGSGPSNGSPMFAIGSGLSGKNRDLHFYGSELKRAGDLIDSLGNRDGGFEWGMPSVINSTDGLPQPAFTTYFPQQGGLQEGLVFKATSQGGNCVPADLEESAATRYSRFWATGVGQAPDQLFAYDEDPNLALGALLRFDGAASYSTVSERPTLASNARRARRFYAPGINNIVIQHNLVQIDPDSYSIGDRARLIVKDRWLDIDMPQPRIVDKEWSTAGAGSIKVTFDLTDDTLPEVDTGGAV